MNELITGIQQVGIGVTDIDTAWTFYRSHFCMDVPVFDDEAEAGLMTRYTGNEIHSRRALLALNMNGGGGFEIWQFKSRTPEKAGFSILPGDLGINAVKLKCRNLKKAHQHIGESTSPIYKAPDGSQHFLVKDSFQNLFQVVEGNSWFRKNSQPMGGVCGVTIGVSDIDAALPLYMTVLQFDEIIYDETGIFEDLGEKFKGRRVLIRKKQAHRGAFSRLFGHVDIELIQVHDRTPRKIFENRYWGDPGFIHVCFDVNDMDQLKKACEENGYNFTVDSGSSFDMGEAAGRFSYIEDPDGTLIEFVNTHKLPIMKKWGLYLNLRKRKEQKPLPDWMLKTLSFNRVSG
jgi:catechol 2,3-dioxygenase-like lactoylglutathione lyase family enzyme